MNFNITKVIANHETDVLTVDAVADDGREVQAFGWVSAMTNHFPPECYDEQSNILPDCEPREMTLDEKRAYVHGLVKALFPDPGLDEEEEQPNTTEEDLTDLFG